MPNSGNHRNGTKKKLIKHSQIHNECVVSIDLNCCLLVLSIYYFFSCNDEIITYLLFDFAFAFFSVVFSRGKINKNINWIETIL